jgi:hypothetical protein
MAMSILRRINILTIIMTAYVAGHVIYQIPYAWMVALAIAGGLLTKKGYHYTAFGTARWASRSELRERGMIDG